ncbi:MAG: ABC transporter permease [Candidatus Aenigmarchaeota archaeon]|nr:ABC transporter permease [Candidatus Aenigmarchaeota archaeon]MCK5372703.1 ABC transporter permease [Candidatus Aenigmarchaeota archaeon]
MISDYFSYAFKNLKHRKVRTWLTMIGIVIGIAAVVSIISLGQGLENVITGQFEDMGADKITIMPGSSIFSAGMTAIIPLNQKDYDAVKRTKGVLDIVGMIYLSPRVEYKDDSDYTFLIGLPLDPGSKRVFDSMQNFKIDYGRDLKDGDGNVIVVGSSVAEDDKLFEKGVVLGSKITINGVDFKVIGVLKTLGNEQDDRSVYINIERARDIFDVEDKYDILFVQVKPGFDVTEIAEDLEDALRKSRDLKEGEEDFNIQTMEQLQESFGTIFSIVQWFLIGVASISIVVGGIGIMNTMYTSVLERTYDIGIMKAIGARNSDILMLFVIEAGTLGAVGGVFGVIVGGGLAKIIEITAQNMLAMDLLKAHLGVELLVGAVLFSFIVGMASGALPARQAAGMKPVDALRYE